MLDKKELRSYLTAAVVGMLCAACMPTDRPNESGTISTPKNGKPTVGVVNYPLKYFVERVAGTNVEILFPVPAEIDPAYWEPVAEDVGEYQQADLILLNGASYARWIRSATLPLSTMVNTSSPFTDRLIPVEDAMTHSHGPGSKHVHGAVAFTTWLDPLLAIEHATSARDALAELLPDLRGDFDRNLAMLRDDLLDLDAAFAKLVENYDGAPILASHPVYQYLARRYGLNLRSVHWEPGEFPSREQWRELDSLLVEHPAAWIVWESRPLEETRTHLARRGIRSVVFETCANARNDRDYIETMFSNVAKIRPVFHDRN